MGFAIQDVRTQSLQASRGATNFGEYFVYFSFFLVISALLLASLFFKLSVEQRVREVGLLRSVGFRQPDVRKIFIGEGLLLSIAGAILGVLGGVAYAYLLVWALRTWWIGAIGTTALTLHISWISAVIGAVGGVAAAMVCIWLTLRGLSRISERSLLAGQLAADIWESAAGASRSSRVGFMGTALAVIGVALLVAAGAGRLDRTGGFFAAGFAMLAACLCFSSAWLRRPDRHVIERRASRPVFRLGMRNARYRPARSVLSMAMIAAASFILISVDAFRKDSRAEASDQHSGTGGYSLLVESLLPIVHNPSTAEGRAALGLDRLGDSVKIDAFRVRPGDDASCLNLYAPVNPRIIAPVDTFFGADRFRFQSSLATTEAERVNPWLLLHRQEPDGAIPVIADANSMTYVLHHKLSDDMTITHAGVPTRLRFVAALDDSIFQGELVMSQANFLRLFPEQEGYQSLLVQTAADQTATASKAIEEALADFGADATSTAERLASFHQVENTYLSTFQMLGGLGLLLGTVGLAAVLLRNVLERRRELALLRALGYQRSHFLAMVLAENAMLLAGGLVIGTGCALLAIAPVLAERGGHLPGVALAALIVALLLSGGVTSAFATSAAIRSSLLSTLRSE
jgi:ABC-type lipoprotein release transport system permease subunit